MSKEYTYIKPNGEEVTLPAYNAQKLHKQLIHGKGFTLKEGQEAPGKYDGKQRRHLTGRGGRIVDGPGQYRGR